LFLAAGKLYKSATSEEISTGVEYKTEAFEYLVLSPQPTCNKIQTLNQIK
jgi:hypothetical protein